MWIIKAIWDIGHDILVSYIPNFLDDKAIAFIFQVCHISKLVCYERYRATEGKKSDRRD